MDAAEFAARLPAVSSPLSTNDTGHALKHEDRGLSDLTEEDIDGDGGIIAAELELGHTNYKSRRAWCSRQAWWARGARLTSQGKRSGGSTAWSNAWKLWRPCQPSPRLHDRPRLQSGGDQREGHLRSATGQRWRKSRATPDEARRHWSLRRGRKRAILWERSSVWNLEHSGRVRHLLRGVGVQRQRPVS